jgi:outer membrane protein assembly factor BamD (BamD/ComL family)
MATAKTRSRAKPTTLSPDHLAVEVQLLTRATSALRSGNFSAALKLLDEHQRSFPNGALQQERKIAKAQALCNLGRTQEGRAELDHLPPQTPATARAHQTCDH